MMKPEVRKRRQNYAATAFVLLFGAALAWNIIGVDERRVSSDPSITALRTTDLIVDHYITLGSGLAVMTTYPGDPNAHVGAAKGSFILDTTTPGVWQNTTGSNVWIAAGGGGSGGGSGFTIAGNGLAGSGSTVSMDGSACSVGWVPTWAGSGSGFVCAAQTGSGGGGGSAAFVSIAQAVTSGTPNLTTLGTNDWLIFQSNTPVSSDKQYSRKLTGARQIERPVWVNTVMSNIASQTRTQTVTWTATDNLSQGSAGAGFATTELAFSAAGTNFGFATSAPAATTSHTFTIYVANFNETDAVTCTAVLADHEVGPQTVSFTMTATDNRTVTVIYNAQQATRINVSCVITSGTNTNLGWLAMWLA